MGCPGCGLASTIRLVMKVLGEKTIVVMIPSCVGPISANYPNSVFYYNGQSNVDFIPIDIEAMKTMYSPGIYSGMTIAEARRLLLND
jgi:hypothetical protein